MHPRRPLPDPLTRVPFARSTALNSGVTLSRLRQPDLQRPFRGVRHPAAGPLSLEQRALALQARLPGAWFCGPTAALLTGVPLPTRIERERILHVAVLHPARAPRGSGIRGHAYRDAKHHPWDGLRVSTPEQIWLHVAAVLTVPELIAAGDYLVHENLPHTSIQRLADAVMANRNARGNAKCRAALPLLNTRSESPRESLLRVLLVSASIPGLEVNVRIVTTDGYRYRGDLVFRSARMIVEYQGDHHRTPEEYRKDLTRISRLEADGWYVMQVGAGDLDNPAELVARIRRKLAARLA